MRTLSLSLLASSFLVTAAVDTARAQVPIGQYIATVGTNEIYYCDPATRKATKLTVAANAFSGAVNCVTMMSPALGFVGTVNNPADIYRITLASTNVTVTKLNKTATPGQNLSQIARVGSELFFATQKGAAGGALASVPMAGGNVTTHVDLGALTGWPSGGLANAVCSDGSSKVWIGVWTGGEIFEYDIAAKTTKLLMKLPGTKGASTTLFYPVNLHFHRANIFAIGLYGDVVEVNPRTAKVVNHWYAKSATGTGLSPYKNAGYFNADTGDWALASRDGAIEQLLPVGDGQIARREIEGVGTAATPSGNSVNGLWYNPGGGSYVAQGAGCAGTGGNIPTSVGRGVAASGNKAFSFGLNTTKSGTNPAILMIGAQKVAINLTGAGAPGCVLQTIPLLILPTVTSGTIDGIGTASIPLPLPQIQATIQTQWVVVDPANKLGLVLSDGRTMALK